ncbi:MAG: PorV/PorQ family protein [Bacteroidetes bacterium]|nr:PorV/PorQ family protein [Bacteroidota bacterium]MBU1116828.1 PorV/PorQ family protein [Bacteroidota bacterium]MBU1796889.1 PorV/PorQ family protein [Bacteroidota bacterium]
MNKLVIKTLLVFIFVAFSINAQYVDNVSKRGTTAAQFLKVSQGARGTGMGSAFVAVSDDASSMFWNVAGIARQNGNSVVFDHTQWIADLSYNFIAGSINLGDFGVIGISFIGSNYGEMNVTTVDEPDGTGSVFSVSDVAVSLGWAINLTQEFSIGFNPKVIQQSIWNTSGTAFAIDMGILYDTPFNGLKIGMAITNLGTKLQLTGNSAVVLIDQDEETTGNNDRIPGEYTTGNWSLPLTFVLGLSYDVIKTDMHKLIVDVDARHPNDNYESVNVGAEYVFNDVIALRGGYKSLFLDQSQESFALGAGFKQKLLGNLAFHIDYAYQDFGILTSIHKVSVGIDF